MKLDATITYNDFTFIPPTPSAGVPLDGTQINEIAFSNVEAFGYLDKRALDDGLDAVDVYTGGRSVNIEAAVFGSTEGRLWDNLADLLAAFDPVAAYNADTSLRGFLPMDFYRPTADVSTWPVSAYPSGIPLRMNLRPSAVPKYRVAKVRTGGSSALGGGIPVSIALVARDPRIFLQSSTTITLSTSSQTATHRGTHQSWPTVTFVMSGAGSSIVNVITDGNTVGLNLSSVSTGTFSLSFQNRHITDENGTSRDDLFRSTWDSVFSAVQPGGSVVRVSTTSNMTVTYAWRESWL